MAIRFFLNRDERLRDRALFDLAINSKLRGCDLVKLKIGNLVAGTEVRDRAMTIQRKTGRPCSLKSPPTPARASRYGFCDGEAPWVIPCSQAEYILANR